MSTVGVLSSAIASAQPDTGVAPPLDRRDHSRITATAGILTPTGELGLEYAYAVHKNAELSVGAGYGFVVRVGPQLSIMPRLRMRMGPVTGSIGVGLSGGKFNDISAFADDNAPKIPTLFLNGEAGLQVGLRQGPFARLFLGVARGLAHDTSDVRADQQAEVRMELDNVLPYVGLSVGTTL